jgi:hypothetical protein
VRCAACFSKNYKITDHCGRAAARLQTAFLTRCTTPAGHRGAAHPGGWLREERAGTAIAGSVDHVRIEVVDERICRNELGAELGRDFLRSVSDLIWPVVRREVSRHEFAELLQRLVETLPGAVESRTGP